MTGSAYTNTQPTGGLGTETHGRTSGDVGVRNIYKAVCGKIRNDLILFGLFHAKTSAIGADNPRVRICSSRRRRSIEARPRGCPWIARTALAAAGGGHLSVCQWVRKMDCPWNDRQRVLLAAKGEGRRCSQRGSLLRVARETMPKVVT